MKTAAHDAITDLSRLVDLAQKGSAAHALLAQHFQLATPVIVVHDMVKFKLTPRLADMLRGINQASLIT